MVWPKDEHSLKFLSPHSFPERLSLGGTKYTKETLPEPHSLPCCPCYRSFWLVDWKTTRETGSVSQQLCHQDIRDCQRKIGVKEGTSGWRCFPLPSRTLFFQGLRFSAIFSPVNCAWAGRATHRLQSVSAPYSNELTNYLLYLKPFLNTW